MAGTDDRAEPADHSFDDGRPFQAGHESSPLFPLMRERPPVLLREVISLVLLVIVSDLMIYRTEGFAGPALFFVVAPILIGVGAVRGRCHESVWWLTVMLITIAGRLVWCGSFAAAIAGFAVLCCFAMSLRGIPPYITWAIAFASRLIAAGLRGLKEYANLLSRYNPKVLQTNWFAYGLPAIVLAAFSTIFVLANPDLVKIFGDNMSRIAEFLEHWIENVDGAEFMFLLGTACLATGLLRPDFPMFDLDRKSPESVPETKSVRSPLYEGYRNTLCVVIVLFVVYLAFEFRTLWFKTFPKGFHYSGYAHEGAAWLTIALALATVLLSLMFRGTILEDPRFSRLRKLSWIWSVENVLLAAAVFNRLFIYMGFNGMTRMRVVGILGVASVVVGFLLVMIKIAQDRDFTWLVRRQLWTVAIATYVYLIFPVDAFVNECNVRRIMAGDPAPSVQISVHPTSDEGYLRLAPLIDCPDAIVRQGVRWMLFDKLMQMEIALTLPRQSGWSGYQVAHERLFRELKKLKPSFEKDMEVSKHDAEIGAFREYAYRWY